MSSKVAEISIKSLIVILALIVGAYLLFTSAVAIFKAALPLAMLALVVYGAYKAVTYKFSF